MALGGQIIRLLLQVVPVLMRAIPSAYAKAIQNAAKNGGTAAAAGNASTSAADLFRAKQMSKQEALQILNMDEAEFSQITPPSLDIENTNATSNNLILERFEKYMNMNEVKRIPNSSYNTGSFYLQSKIYHAKETLMRELASLHQPSPPPPPPPSSSSSGTQ